jgi:hypothetical protein
VNEVRVTSWNELNEQLYQGSWQEPLRRYRSTFAFRGMTDAAHDLQSSLRRLGGPYAKSEGHLLRNFRKYAQRGAARTDSIWNWLAVAQHHGLPTRLLDWTYSPYVAIHFATESLESFDTDGVIWCVDYTRTNALLPAKLRKLLRDEGSDLFTAEMLSRAADALTEFDRLAGGDDFVLFWEPPSLDERIVNQFALFSLMSSPDARLDEWLSQHPDCYRRIILPTSIKWEIRDKLDQANITERVLFPGLDGLSAWLKRYYSPRPP